MRGTTQGEKYGWYITVRRAQRGVPRSAPYRPLKGYPTGIYFMVGQRMERKGGTLLVLTRDEGKECPPPARNRSERAKVANVAEWKPPASPGAQYFYARMNERGAPLRELPIGGW